MARRSSSRNNEENVKDRRGPIQYPYVVYASKGHSENLKWLILKFTDAWGARNMIHHIIGKDTYEWKIMKPLGWNYMLTSSGVQISLRNNNLNKEVMELEFDEENSYMSPEVRYFNYGPSESHRSRRVVTADDADDQPAANTRSEKPSRAVKERRPKVDRSGLISANDIATELGATGRDVRGVLRTLKLSKPVGGWNWPKAEAEEIKKKIKEGLKAKKK